MCDIHIDTLFCLLKQKACLRAFAIIMLPVRTVCFPLTFTGRITAATHKGFEEGNVRQREVGGTTEEIHPFPQQLTLGHIFFWL